MFWFKGCPRCFGNIYEDRDWYGRFIACVQCSLSKDITERGGRLLEMSAGAVHAPVPVVPRTESGQKRRLSHGGRHFARTFAPPGGYRAESAA